MNNNNLHKKHIKYYLLFVLGAIIVLLSTFIPFTYRFMSIEDGELVIVAGVAIAEYGGIMLIYINHNIKHNKYK